MKMIIHGEDQEIKGENTKKNHTWIMCPICKKTGVIHVESCQMMRLLENKQDALVQITIPQGKICDHEFPIKLDSNFRAR